MTKKAKASHDRPDSGPRLEDLPHDELLSYGRGLGMELDDKLTSVELSDRVRRHHDLLRGLDRDGLLDIIKWSRQPIRQNAGTEELARQIAQIQQANYDSLSRRGLITLAQLRGLETSDADNTQDIIEKLRRQLGFWQRWHRKRRSLVGSMLSKLVDDKTTHAAGDYQFLPDEGADTDADSAKSLKRQIEDYGVVGGIASKLRGAADDYIKIKLDEIEHRIDTKMDQIDQRLAEWRDREVANRLKIIRITLAATVLVAILSLGYNYLKDETPVAPAQSVEQTTQKSPG